jgi:hypothetical protein
MFLTGGATRATAAKAAGITTRTLDRYFQDPAFRLDLAAARRAAYEDALGGLKGASGRAVETLSALLASRNETTRRQAASEILSFAFRSHETGEIEERISALEKIAKEISHRAGAAEDAN